MSKHFSGALPTAPPPNHAMFSPLQKTLQPMASVTAPRSWWLKSPLLCMRRECATALRSIAFVPERRAGLPTDARRAFTLDSVAACSLHVASQAAAGCASPRARRRHARAAARRQVCWLRGIAGVLGRRQWR